MQAWLGALPVARVAEDFLAVMEVWVAQVDCLDYQLALMDCPLVLAAGMDSPNFP